MSAAAYLSLGALLITALLAAYLVWRSPSSPTAQLYVVLLATFILWDIPEFVIRLEPPLTDAAFELLVRVEWTGISLIPAVMAHFVLSYPRRSRLLDRPWALLLLYAPSIVFTSFLWGGDLLVAGIVVGPLGIDGDPGLLYPYLGTLYAVIILWALSHLWRSYQGETDPRARRRYVHLLVGFGVPVLAGSVTEIYGPLLFDLPTRLGLGTVYTAVFGAFMAYAVFRHGMLVIEPAREAESVGRFSRAKGRNYLLLSPSRSDGFSAFRALVQEVPGLCVTAFPPTLLAEAHDLRRVPFLWLSAQEGYRETLKPVYLEADVLQTLLRFIRDHPGAALLWDDLEYLVAVNGSKAVLRTLHRVAAAASQHGCTLIATIHPDALSGPETAALAGVFDEVEPLEGPDAAAEPAFVPPGCLLWTGDRGDCFRALSRAALGRKTVASTLYPEKLRSSYDLREAGFLWLTPDARGETPAYDPTRLTLEVRRDLTRQAAPDSLLYLGELEVLVQEAGFLEVLEYVKQVGDAAVLRGSLVVASVQASGLPPGPLATLTRRFAGTAD